MLKLNLKQRAAQLSNSPKRLKLKWLNFLTLYLRVYATKSMMKRIKSKKRRNKKKRNQVSSKKSLQSCNQLLFGLNAVYQLFHKKFQYLRVHQQNKLLRLHLKNPLNLKQRNKLKMNLKKLKMMNKTTKMMRTFK